MSANELAPPMTCGGLVLAAGHGLLALSVADIGVGGSIALLVPGMLLEGAGMGLVITPLTSTVLGNLRRGGLTTGPDGHERQPRRRAATASRPEQARARRLGVGGVSTVRSRRESKRLRPAPRGFLSR